MKLMQRLAAKAIAGWMLAWIALSAALAQPVLYGGLGGKGVSGGPQASTNDGSLVIVSQSDGSTKVVGHPAGAARLSGLAFGLDGSLYGATQESYGFPPPVGAAQPSNLIRIDPDTGALISSVPIMQGAENLSISDLAVQPTTGALYGIRKFDDRLPTDGKLYVIDTTTGAATLLGDTGLFFASIAFAPDGTLYMSAATYDEQAGPVAPFTWLTLNPANAATLTSVLTSIFYHSLSVRPTDGVIFGGTADKQGVYTINPTTGGGTLIGMTSQKDLVGDLAFRPVAGPPAAFDLNQHGLTGSWYEPATGGQGIEVEVFPNASGTGSTFVSWFTYDTVSGGADHQRWYTAQGLVVTGQPNAALTIYQNTGGNFNAPPVTNAQAVGTATLSFDTCSSGQLVYTFTDGTDRTGTIPLTRLTQNVTCSTTSPRPTNGEFALSGNWFGGAATSGQGFTAEVNPTSGAFFAAWYTYMPNGAAAGAAGQRWYTAQGTFTPGLRSIPVTIYETTGGMFDTPTPAGQKTVAVGTGTMTFQSCSAATFSYSFTGGSSNGLTETIALSRVGPVPSGCTA